MLVALTAVVVSLFAWIGVSDTTPLGGDGDSNFINLVASGDVTSGDDVVVGDDLTVAGKATVAGQITNTPDEITATTTLTSDSSTMQFLASSSAMATITLPPVSEAGTMFTFVVTGPQTGSSVVISSAEGSNIQGILMVNDADVACADEDQLNIVTDGEVIGDRVTIISNGVNWFILDSDIDAAGKMTCTT